VDDILGAAGLGDIGQHFPSDDPRYAGAASADLVRTVMEAARAVGWVVVNVDATVIAQAPRLAPHLPAMRAAIATALGASEDTVNVKAKTADHLGALGREEGIAALAVVLLQRAADSA
jgi:2-C-methyl-D-erythritol 2,4-cyclodiphosphate synthase